MKTVFIYALCEPDGQVRYIGKTYDLRKRLNLHCGSRARVGQYRRACWIRNLFNRGLKPKMKILTIVDETNWEFWEKEYIKLYREIGFDLVNTSAGGEGGMQGRTHTPKARAIISAKLLGKRKSETHRTNISIGKKGKKSTQDIRGIKNPMYGRPPWNKGLKISKEFVCSSDLKKNSQ